MFLYLIIGFACDDPGIFIMVEQLISTFSLFSNVLMYKRHNNVLKIINNEFNSELSFFNNDKYLGIYCKNENLHQLIKMQVRHLIEKNLWWGF